MSTLKEELIVIFTLIALILAIIGYVDYAFIIFAAISGFVTRESLESIWTIKKKR